MKKILALVSVLVMVLFLTSCLNYKAYDVPNSTEEEEGETDLINEIAEIERQLEDNDLVEEAEDVVVEEEVTIDMEEAEEEVEEVDEEVLMFYVSENEAIKLNVNIIDPDNDDVTYAFTSPLNEMGEWQTSYGDAGEYYVTLTATDQVHTVTQDILIIVNRVNVAPEIEDVDDMYYSEGDVIEFEAVVSDPNNDAVTVTVSEPLASGIFVSDHTSAGDYTITVLASDGELETEISFLLSITDVNELPILSGFDDEISVNEGETVVIEPEVSDLDGDEITITISDPVGSDGVWDTSFTDNGEYSITITAYDGKDTVSDTINLVVEDVNMPPEIIEVSADAE
ncbi:hypothetical protein HN385_02935 [archaeon]|jgi:hypothetical protein|nr:hypothetical protein [archaeon]MBT3450582.1 hypothetical protein [archaeon]MBT6868436.1 hypothetical protein [archaeon]MBT7193535.1 hypothetical protein [archaeon]MBT7381270.1 hypothetical protein [archaeon]